MSSRVTRIVVNQARNLLKREIKINKTCQTYETDTPVNAVTLSPLIDHVVLGGGQDASSVTNNPRAGKFEAKFYHKVLEEEIGAVKGYFGPINALAFNPDGKSFSSGGEDGMTFYELEYGSSMSKVKKG
ncbi:hypothetical protein AgCh_024898 [Apium graveolens]